MKQKSSILIAENKTFLVDVIREAFGRDFNCICVQTGEKLFEKLGEADAAVIGLDVFQGDEAQRIAMIGKVKEKRDIPILALTSIQYSSVRIDILKTGADDVMTKPFNPDEMVVRVEKILSRYK